MTAAQLRNVTVKHDIHPDADVYVEGPPGDSARPVTGYRVVKIEEGRFILILDTYGPEKE